MRYQLSMEAVICDDTDMEPVELDQGDTEPLVAVDHVGKILLRISFNFNPVSSFC